MQSFYWLQTNFDELEQFSDWLFEENCFYLAGMIKVFARIPKHEYHTEVFAKYVHFQGGKDRFASKRYDTDLLSQ